MAEVSALIVVLVLAFGTWLGLSGWISRRRRLLQLASSFPGPPTKPIIGNALLFATKPDDTIQICWDIADRFDRDPFRLWLFHKFAVILSKPKDIEAVLGNTKLFSKSRQYDILQSLMGQGLFTSVQQTGWRHSRKLVTPAFHFTILKGFLSIFFQEASVLADKLSTKLDEKLDVYPLVGLCTLDSICRTSLGVRVHAQNGHGSEFVENLDTVLKVWQQRIVQIWLTIPILFAMTKMKSEHDIAVKKTLGFTDKIIKERRQEWLQNKGDFQKKIENGEKMAFLDLLLESGMTDEQLRDETMTIIIAGHETTGTEISFALLLLAMHPDVQAKVHEELDSIFADDVASMPSFHDLNKMEYLERVVKESMRLFPALPGVGRKIEEEVQLEKNIIPKGIDVGIFVYGAHRDPESWENPDQFNPDNFLPEKCRSRHPYAYLPFSAGLRNCIGQKYALLQIKTVVSTLLRRYRISTGPEYQKMSDIQISMATTLKSKKGINMIFHSRDKSS